MKRIPDPQRRRPTAGDIPVAPHVPMDPYDALREQRGEDPWEAVLAAREEQQERRDRTDDYTPKDS